jgi:hypothetical protein
MKYLKGKINGLATHRKKKNSKDLNKGKNEFKRSY